MRPVFGVGRKPPEWSPEQIDIIPYQADGNVNWDGQVHGGQVVNGAAAGPYLYGGFSTSPIGGAAVYSSRWWHRDFGSGGLYNIGAVHVTGFDVGIYSFCIDDREVGRLDGYSLVDVNNIFTIVASNVRITPGRHKFSIVMVDHNASASGLPWYPAISGLVFQRTGSIKAPAAYGLARGQGEKVRPVTVNRWPMMATGFSQWDTLAPLGIVQNHAAMYFTDLVSGATIHTRWWDENLAAGQWDLDLVYSTANSYGIMLILLDGVQQGDPIDMYSSAAYVNDVHTTRRLTVPFSGKHRLMFQSAGKNPSSTYWSLEVNAFQLRQVAPLALSEQVVPPLAIDMAWFWAAGNTNWTDIYMAVGGGGGGLPETFGADIESTGAQNAERYWYVNFPWSGWYDFEFLNRLFYQAGIYAILIDDVWVEQFDGYYASDVKDVRTRVLGIAVTAGRRKVTLKMTTVNAGNTSGYYYALGQGMQIRYSGPVVIFAGLSSIPLMTSNSAPAGVASASSELAGGGYEAYCAMNPAGGNARGWLNNGGGSPSWIGYQFPSPVVIRTYSLRPWWFNVFPGRTPKTWKFQGSNDNLTWADLDSQTNYSFANSTNVITFTIASPGSYQYYRLYVTANNGDAYTGLGVIQMNV